MLSVSKGPFAVTWLAYLLIYSPRTTLSNFTLISPLLQLLYNRSPIVRFFLPFLRLGLIFFDTTSYICKQYKPVEKHLKSFKFWRLFFGEKGIDYFKSANLIIKSSEFQSYHLISKKTTLAKRFYFQGIKKLNFNTKSLSNLFIILNKFETAIGLKILLYIF